MRCLLALLVTACATTPCPDEPLSRPSETPAFVVRVHDRLPPPDEVTLPGTDRAPEPFGLGEYASHALYAADGRLLAERWLDNLTRWEGAAGTVDAASVLPARMRPGGLTVLLADGRRSRVRFETTSGLLLSQRETYTSPPPRGGQLIAETDLGDGTVLLSRARTDAAPADLLWIDADESEGAPRDVFGLSDLSSGRVTPGRGAPFTTGAAAERALITLWLEDEPDAGAFALVTPGDDDVTRVDLPGVSGCVDAAPVAPSGDTPRVVVLCVGDPTRPAIERDRAGLVLLEAERTGPPIVAATRTQNELFRDYPPSSELVGLGGTWVAYLSEGDATRADVLLAVHMESDAGVILWEEDRTEIWGPALGSGDFAPGLGGGAGGGVGELWWPSTREGVLRFEQTSEGADARFVTLAAAPQPGCSRLPPRAVRHLPPPAP